ncbi:uncharacterized protein LOC131214077 [Anopheles bellator]|uniref:uncharacterized protein LOC131214077 n=1 Tax=Anopheles bellator TaxID=139047 RepID=UPI00264A2C05|nr:uncharacterized protein LOC131214077 [Anopheles bellator]
MRKLSLSTGAGMSRQSKTAPQVKKVLPPAVPEIYGKITSNNSKSGQAEQGSVAGCPSDPSSCGENGSERTIDSSTAPSSLMLRCAPDGGGGIDYGLDDQGIDLTQSPGRDSPVSLSESAGSGSRHSTASLDSGRASSYLTGASNSSNRSVSGVGSYGVLSSPRCSVSSCSIGSGSGGSSSGVGSGTCGSHRLSNHSNRCDHDAISEWLMEIHFHEYTYLFLDAGYDLATIARMTPEDLTAIGIRKPNHRERLKRHIDALKLSDALPVYVPGSIEEWLRLLRLEEYVQPLLAQGYQTVHDVTQLTWEDLEDIGIVKLGHQKKILLAIKRVKDIISGKILMMDTPSYASTSGMGLSPTTLRASTGTVGVRTHNDDMGIGLRSDSAKLLQQQQLNAPTSTGGYSTFLRQQLPQPPLFVPQLHSRQQQLHQQMITYPHVHFDGSQAIYRRSSYDDSDITPTNEKASVLMALSGSETNHGVPLHQLQQQQTWKHSQHQQQQQQYFQGGGTLPRQHQRNSYGARLAFLGPNATPTIPQRQRPIAKIVANNLKLAGVASGGTPSTGNPVPPVVDGGTEPAATGVGFPLPPMLGHIGNVEMATAALDAMHFSNFSSTPYPGAQHHTSPKYGIHASGSVDEPSGAVSSMPRIAGIQPASGQQQQQPIYYNQIILQSHHSHHHHTHHSYSSQSTPSPPTQHTLLPLAAGPFGDGCYAGQTHQTTVEVHKVSTQHDNKSNSSLESIDQIPFANENAGTIKQRSSFNRMEHQFGQQQQQQQQQQQHHHPLLLPTLSSSSSTSSSSSSSSGSITTTLATCNGALQQQSPSGSAPGLTVQPTKPAAPGSFSPASADSGNVIVAPTPNESQQPVVAEVTSPNTGDIYGTNVLNDIGNMLANLTDELDAMLEEEKCAGISDVD